MAFREGIPDLGSLGGTASVEAALESSVIAPVLQAPNLIQALETLSRVSKIQTPGVETWLKRAGDEVQVCLELPLGRETPGHVIAETRTLKLMLNVISEFLGIQVSPREILLSAPNRDIHFDLDCSFQGIPVKTGQDYGAIVIPKALLAKNRTKKKYILPKDAISETLKPEIPSNFADTLVECILPYILQNSTRIEVAAEIAHTSVRSLQRELAKHDTTYRSVVQRARMVAAMSELRDSTSSLRRVALRLGYSEQSAFSRAFNYWTGLTPQEYRKLHH
jgi:AraC-like DNA-binding protein